MNWQSLAEPVISDRSIDIIAVAQTRYYLGNLSYSDFLEWLDRIFDTEVRA